MELATPKTIPEDRIRAIAHQLWLDEGCPDGRADAHWEKANALAAKEVEAVVAKPKKPVARKAKTKG